jgi:aryl-alcohol dehydrogenase-like predicted oxidoreductase
MINRKIGSLSVSPTGLGCMNLSFGYGSVDEETASTVLLAALDEGVTFFDTAFMYGGGHNETLVGKVLKPHRKRFVLATKCGLSGDGIDGRPATIRKQCETSLTRLQTDVIDLYYLHRVDPQVPIEESVGAMSDLVREGKVQELGLSEVSCKTLAGALTEHAVAAVQSEYSLWSRTPEHGMLNACEKAGVAFVPFSPLGRGFLAGSAQSVDDLADDDLRSTIARPRFEPDAFAKNLTLLNVFSDIAEQHACTCAQLALAWLLHRENNRLVPIPGTRNLQHMRDNAASANIVLTVETVAQLDELINDATVTGSRYTSDRMSSTDSELDVVAASEPEEA